MRRLAHQHAAVSSAAVAPVAHRWPESMFAGALSHMIACPWPCSAVLAENLEFATLRTPSTKTAPPTSAWLLRNVQSSMESWPYTYTAPPVFVAELSRNSVLRSVTVDSGQHGLPHSAGHQPGSLRCWPKSFWFCVSWEMSRSQPPAAMTDGLAMSEAQLGVIPGWSVHVARPLVA